MTVQFYIDKFQTLRLDRSNGHAKPHKVCLLFAIIDLIEQGIITDNKILFNEQLKTRFSFYFEQFKQGNDKNSPYLPFYYLKSSQFWHLHFKPEYQKEFSQLKSVSNAAIQRCVDFAYFDEELFDYIKAPSPEQASKMR